MTLHVGIDDTDSRKGMCTTYILAMIIDKLKEKLNLQPIDFPKLVRLNPACPYKTRGNAAVAIKLGGGEERLKEVKEIVKDVIIRFAELEDPNTDPGAVFYIGETIPRELADFSNKAVKEIVGLEEALNLARKYNIEVLKFKKGRGIIGALAAISNEFPYGVTYELIAYRTPEYRGKPREIDIESVFEMDFKTKGCTFDNLDPESGEIKITPHTPCPVLFGIRALKPDCLEKALSIVKVKEPIERYLIFKTNQATDAHIVVTSLSEVKPFTNVAVRGKISSTPTIIKGGHVFVKMSDGKTEFRLAAYEPTKSFRNIIRSLIPGDEIIAYGSYKPREGEPPTINLEKIHILRLAEKYVIKNPICPKCGKRMKSEGKNKGFQCPRCKYKAKDLERIKEKLTRDITEGMYEVPPRARRHLTKPISHINRKT